MDKDRLEEDVHSDIEIEQDWPVHPFNTEEKMQHAPTGVLPGHSSSNSGLVHILRPPAGVGNGQSSNRDVSEHQQPSRDSLAKLAQRESAVGESDGRSLQTNLSLHSDLEQGMDYSPDAVRSENGAAGEDRERSSSGWGVGAVVKKCRNFVAGLCSSNRG